MNRVFLHGIHYAPVVTSPEPRDRQAVKTKPQPKKRSKIQNDNEQWEKDACNVCIPEVHEDDKEKPQVPPEKYDVEPDCTEELPQLEATETETQENDVVVELKEVADAIMTDDEPQ